MQAEITRVEPTVINRTKEYSIEVLVMKGPKGDAGSVDSITSAEIQNIIANLR